jgi:hypothetical protein
MPLWLKALFAGTDFNISIDLVSQLAPPASMAPATHCHPWHQQAARDGLRRGQRLTTISNQPMWCPPCSQVSLLVNLLISVLVPSIIGKLCREYMPGCQKFVTKYKVPLSLFSTANLAFIIWQVLSSAQEVCE